MSPSNKRRDHAPLKEITNTNVEQSPVDDPRERKRQRDRERYAQMPKHKKQALLQRQCEQRQQKKAARNITSQVQPQSGGCIELVHDSTPNMTHTFGATGAYKKV